MKNKGHSPDRRLFLKGSVLAGAAGAIGGASAEAATPATPAPAAPASPAVRPPWLTAAETRTAAAEEPQHIKNPGSDYMVDLMRALDIEYIGVMPGSTFRGLQESLINYGGGKGPEIIVCTHEEISAAIGHGYAKVAGKPMACLVHSNVGLQHASMAIFNAYCDRAPLVVIAGNVLDAVKRRPGVEWYHTAQDLGVMVRDFIKWDDTPASLRHYGESFMRAHAMCMTPPMGPVMIVADAELQEHPAEDPALRIPKATVVKPPVGDPASIAQTADLLVQAKTPLIVADRAARTAEGMALLVKLAETLNAPVVDQLGRLNFPNTHYLNQSWLQAALVRDADVILGLELGDPWGVANTVPDIISRPSRRLTKPDSKFVHITADYLFEKSNHQDFERYFAPDLAIGADAEATLPSLIAAVEQRLTPERREAIAARKPALEAAYKRMREASRAEAARAWDASPITTARMCMELWDKVKGEDWAIVSATKFFDDWPHRLWDMDKFHQYIGGQGGYGVGYGAPAAVGAALAHKKAGRLAINVQGDGDLMCTPGVFWTLAHHQIPLLTVMHNNRAWHQETMHIQRMANRRRRGPENAHVGTVINDPPIDYAALARSMGVWAEGPISDPARLGPVFARAVAVVKSGKPALVDVVTQPR